MAQHAPFLIHVLFCKSPGRMPRSLEKSTFASRQTVLRRTYCLRRKWTLLLATLATPFPRSMLWTSVVGATMIRVHHRRRLWPNGRSVGRVLHAPQASRRRWAQSNLDRIGKRQPFWHRSPGRTASRHPLTLLRDWHRRELQWMARLRTQTVNGQNTRHRPAAGQHTHHGSSHSRAGHSRHSRHSRHGLPRAGSWHRCTLQCPASHQRPSGPSRRR